jgi:hypothetical protein
VHDCLQEVRQRHPDLLHDIVHAKGRTLKDMGNVVERKPISRYPQHTCLMRLFQPGRDFLSFAHQIIKQLVAKQVKRSKCRNLS